MVHPREEPVPHTAHLESGGVAKPEPAYNGRGAADRTSLHRELSFQRTTLYGEALQQQE